MHRLRLCALLVFAALLAGSLAAAPAPTDTPPPPTDTPLPAPTATLTSTPTPAPTPSIGELAALCVGGLDKCVSPALKHYPLGILLVAIILLMLLLSFFEGIRTGVKKLGENFVEWISGHLHIHPDPTRYYLEKFHADYKDPKFQSLKALAREVRMPELKEIYVPAGLMLETPEAERAAKTEPGLEMGARLRAESKPVTLTEAVQKTPGHLALIGIAGCGKSTELQWAGVTCALGGLGRALSPEQKKLARALAHGRPLIPVLLPLGAFDRWCQAKADRAPTAGALLEFAAERFNRLHEKQPLTSAFFKAKLRAGALVLLDGVDEVTPERRGPVRAAMQALLQDYAGPRTRALLTSRPAAYFGPAQAANFLRAEIQPLADEQRNALIRSLHTSMYAPDADKAERESRDLLRRMDASDEKVKELARTPLLSTIFALVHRAKRQLPQQRAELYEEAVATLLEESYRKDDAEAGTRSAEADPNLRRDRLALMAFHLHDCKAGDEGLSESKLLERVWPAFGGERLAAEDAARAFMHGIANRGGLLEEVQERRYGFRSHRTFQEFLAGRYLVRGYAPFDLKKQGEFLSRRLADDHWEEPARLAAGYLSISGAGEAEGFIKMAFSLGGDDAEGDRATAIAGLALADLPEAHLKSLCGTCDQLRKAMREVFQRNPPRLELPLRRRLGLALGAVGDPRLCPGGLPALVAVPAGEFKMGTSDEEKAQLEAQQAPFWLWSSEQPQHPVSISAFQISQYPVTNAEFRAFVEADGYNPEKPWWQGDARRWRTGALEPDPSIYGDPQAFKKWFDRRPFEKRNCPFFWDDPAWNAPNLPVVGVTWYEADAYCCWLSAVTGQPFRLPTEAEWEKAARFSPPPHAGVGANLWPWGDAWDANLCNCVESGFNATTPVGMYPGGASSCGALDMVGNVWEWCADWQQNDLYPQRAGQEIRDPVGPPAGKVRVVRGGAYDLPGMYCRAAHRNRDDPAYFHHSAGFRVVCAPVK